MSAPFKARLEQIRVFLLTEYMFFGGETKKKYILVQRIAFIRYTQDQKLIIMLTAKAHKSNNILRYYKL